MNFTKDQWNHGCKIMIYKFIQHIIKEHPSLLKELLEPWRVEFINIWLQCQKMCVLIN